MPITSEFATQKPHRQPVDADLGPHAALGVQPSRWLQLPSCFYQRLTCSAAPQPALLWWNSALAAQYALPTNLTAPQQAHYAQWLTASVCVPGAQPLALAYAGHQFGHFAILGDGRAALLGDITDRQGQRRELQLKGSGPTPFARRGDGLAALGPMLREVIVSEAMAALGVPTTRALAVCRSGYVARRERPEPAAVLARLASSHLRVGSFEWAAYVDDERRDANRSATRALLQFAQSLHGGADTLDFLQQVCTRQVALVLQWQQFGFIHGVMNTDNMSIAGETLDYGPCAFVDDYVPAAVFSSIDHMGRYAWQRQYAVAMWNAARLADCLVPLLASEGQTDQAGAIAAAEGVLANMQAQFATGDATMRAAKLGLALPQDAAAQNGVQDLCQRWWSLLTRDALDYTNAHRALLRLLQPSDYDPSQAVPWSEAVYRAVGEGPDWVRWRSDYQAYVQTQPQLRQERVQMVQRANPARIARNHRVQAALSAADLGDNGPLQSFLQALREPFVDDARYRDYALPPQPHERITLTFCGT